MDYWANLALRPLRHYADFRTRSTRSELIVFYFFLSIASVILRSAVEPLSEPAARVGSVAFGLLTLCPLIAVMVRRLHDQGRSGWWLLIAALPCLAALLWEAYLTEGAYPVTVEIEELLAVPAIAVGLSALAVLVLLLWRDQEGTNRYGPNPRYEDAPAAD